MSRKIKQYENYPTPPSEDSIYPSSGSESSTSPIHYTQLVLKPNYYSIAPHVQNIIIQEENVVENMDEPQPYLEIIEQPVDKFRFRYKSEMSGTHGSLNGETSNRTRKMTVPTVKLVNFEGTAILRCSIWQINCEDNDFMPHAHRLVKKKHGKEEVDDPHDIEVNGKSKYQAAFHSMGIIHTAKKHLVSELMKKKTFLKKEFISRRGRTELNKKEEMEIKGYAEAESKSINLNVVCLRFDAFVVRNNSYFPICKPVFSHGVNNLKSALTGELRIARVDHCTSPAEGGREIFLLVERVTKKNIKVRFYELDEDDKEIWEAFGNFNDLDVHHQYAIVLKTPPYKDKDIKTQTENVYMELVRPSDNAKSESREFVYMPNNNSYKIGTKRPRLNGLDSKDYDTLSIGNETIPITLENMTMEFEDINDNNSEELSKAVERIDSEELQTLCSNIEKETPTFEFLAQNFDLSFDCHAKSNSRAKKPISGLSVEPFAIHKKYESRVQRVNQEISEFLKSKPSLQKIKKIINHYLADSKEELNAFHMAVMINDTRVIKFFVKLICFTQELHLINIQNPKFGTVLHLASLCNNVELIVTLISTCNADISKRDANQNTPLHIAAEISRDGRAMEALVKSKNLGTCINYKNKDNDTALHVAAKKKNLKALQILYKNKADIDSPHDCNGFTPLRFAMENDDTEMVKFILFETNVNPRTRDFQGIEPLLFGLNHQKDQEIKDLVENYMKENEIPKEEIYVKEEPKDESSEEMDVDEGEVACKYQTDPLTLYENVTHFTDECLDEVSKELDKSGKLQDLATLLDVEHLLRVPTFDENISPSKQLINFVIESNSGSIKDIRDLLDSLDERNAVQAIDKMVLHFNNS